MIEGGYWIEAVSAKGVASAKAFGPEPATAEESEARNRFAHVIRAAGRVAAAAGEQRREHDLVYADEGERDSGGQAHITTYAD